MEITDSEFDKFVKDNKFCVIDFWAPWCGPCRMLGPVLEEACEETGVPLGKVNVDENKEHAVKFGVMSIPCLILFKDGKAVDKTVGNLPKSKLVEALKKLKADA